MKQPNIVLIMTDQLRGDCMGFMGHPDVKTPYLDTLASKGVAFDHAYSSCPTCIPARAALHTGMSQTGHGRVGYEDGVAWNYAHTMARSRRTASIISSRQESFQRPDIIHSASERCMFIR